MKAIILAADGKEFTLGEEIIPKCFLPLNNNTTILERQIRILNLVGFSSEDIIVVIGSLGSWAIGNISDRINSISANIVTNYRNTREGNKDSVLVALDQLADEDVVFIDGDLVFERDIIDRLIKDTHENVLVTRNLMNAEEGGYRIYSKNDKVQNISRKNGNEAYPWQKYTGIARVSKDLAKHIKSVLISNDTENFLDGIAVLLNDFDIMTVDYLDLTYGYLSKNRSDQLIGGSYANLKCKLIVRKEADISGKAKLTNEIKWLLDLPPDLKDYFPEVLSYDIMSDNLAWYEMPFYTGRNLRELIMVGEYGSDDTINFLERLLSWMFENVYSRERGITPINWVLSKHINRVFQRMIDSSLKSNTLEKLIKAEYLIVNGKEYRNIKEIYLKIAQRPDLLEILKPEKLVMIHGDLHFQNILLDERNEKGFLLADPRGEMYGSDIYYDLGKLWHCFNGKYDFIHTDQFRLDINWIDNGMTPKCGLVITNELAENIYDEINNKAIELMNRLDFVRNDSNWEMKIMFNEASHFCSVMPFHIDKTATHDRAAALYLTGVKLINDFYDNFKIENYKEMTNYYNINTLEDYNTMIKSWGLDERSRY